MPAAPARPRIRPVKVLAAGWLIGAAGLTALVAPQLGWRGWMWLGVFDLLSLVGSGWELWFRPASPALVVGAGKSS